MIRMAKELGGTKELNKILLNSEKELMKKLPELLKRTGHKNVNDLVKDYGFDINKQEGKIKLLSELAARWAETLINKPKPSWWKEFLMSIQKWITKFTGKILNEDEVNALVGGFVRYGTLNTENKVSNATLSNLKKQGYYKSIPENLLGVMTRNSVLSKVTRDLEDKWYFVRGELDQNNNINDNVARYNQFMSMNNINKDMFVYNNTEGDKAPYLTINPKFKEEDTIVENDEKIHKEKYEAIIQFFQDKFGIKKEQIVYTTKAEFKRQFPEAYQENMQSVYSNGKFYFFTRNLTSDITVEELLHPFIYTVKELNPQLFNNLLKEAKLHYPKLNTKIQTLYAGKTKSVRDQELVTQALSRVFNNVYENEEPQSLIDTIQDFVKWIREIMSDILNYFKTGKYINVPIEKLDPQTSLYEIAKIINAVDTRFDVIFPNRTLYSLEENTPNFNRTVKEILTNEKVAAKINEILVKLPEHIKNFKK
jgi:hypothetical protein